MILEIITNAIDRICEILNGPNIRLSVLNPSITALAIPYIIKYKHVSSPENFLLFLYRYNNTKIIKVQIDSYKNVG